MKINFAKGGKTLGVKQRSTNLRTRTSQVFRVRKDGWHEYYYPRCQGRGFVSRMGFNQESNKCKKQQNFRA